MAPTDPPAGRSGERACRRRVRGWLLRGGFPLSPLLVGAVADLTSLRAGLLSVVLAGVVTIALAPRPGRPHPLNQELEQDSRTRPVVTQTSPARYITLSCQRITFGT
ncbi:hypothetical protein FH608_016915 [Nonomuraea phyllanthi]|uniref:Uncharacterized protein n=1 Tax=Nonomuraea phyllanthi TaxID=2219224 RepID=A0A5C4WMK3_9ACTN|nr:MFS transporter [Nonomuraea phyllanthi]KAB8194839.1 hypothetical protein FH608_016915 [Nonomuraea phyllanthi]